MPQEAESFVGGVVGTEHPLQPLPRPRGQGVAAAQQQHPVGPGRVVLAAPTTAMGAGQALPDGGDHVVPELDQVELVDRDRGARQPGPQRLAERGRGIDRDDLDPLPPLLRALREPIPDGPGVPAVDDAEDLPGGQVDQRRHPRLEPSPSALVGAEPAH